MARNPVQFQKGMSLKYDTAWAIKHKLMAAMQDRNMAYKLKGDVQIDDAYLGGERKGTLAAELRARPLFSPPRNAGRQALLYHAPGGGLTRAQELARTP